MRIMLEEVWKCRIMRATDGSLVMDVPQELAEALRAASGDDLEVTKTRNGLFELWKPEPPFDPEGMVEYMNRICREALEEPVK
jgi:antitoxin component of MazEF toxin-antitoxin module